MLSSFADRRCLVTGGLGFVGSNLALALAEADAEVTVVDARVPTHGANPHNLEGAARHIDVLEADLGAADAVGDAVAGADVIFNLAGQVSHVESMARPLFDLDVNTRSQLAFLEILRSAGSQAVVIYTSTRQIFGHPRYLPVDEDHPVSPVDVNGITKWAAEQLHLLYTELYGIRACAVRLTNVYGPRQRLKGDLQGFLPIFVRRALAGEPITVFGDGAQERDCLYVDDVVECLLLAGRSADATGEVFNVGNDERLSLRQIAEAVVAAAGSGSVESVPWPPDRDAIDIGSYYGDSSKAKRVLGWEPRTAFTDGIRRTIDFYRSRRSHYL
ncbi:MAG TPA: NAD-dependent epimerase/dehydratase family protein [Acidimicrobiia bacterium]|nr:NAD-dependent epimerase/dehydratase family protein [Acidimicrobiia bacterium]